MRVSCGFPSTNHGSTYLLVCYVNNITALLLSEN